MSAKTHYRVILNEEERAYLRRLLHQGTGKHRSTLRIQILLLADETDAPDPVVAQYVHTSHDTVYRTRKRYVEAGLLAAITERPRSGAPRRLNEEQEQFVVALASADPPPGHAVWTMQLLADTLVEWHIVEPLSDETVRRTLKKTSASPGNTSRG